MRERDTEKTAIGKKRGNIVTLSPEMYFVCYVFPFPLSLRHQFAPILHFVLFVSAAASETKS